MKDTVCGLCGMHCRNWQDAPLSDTVKVSGDQQYQHTAALPHDITVTASLGTSVRHACITNLHSR